MRVETIFRELMRRHVFHVAVVYGAVGWLVMQVANNFFPPLHLPAWTVTFVAVLTILGFPIALVLAWAFDLTPGGVRRTESTPAALHGAPPRSDAAGARASIPAREVAGGVGLRTRPLRDRTLPRSEPHESPTAVTDASPPDPERVKRASLAGLRHDLRTPINAILGYSEMLIEDASDADRQEALPDLRRIHAAGRELLSLVDRALNPGRLSTELTPSEADNLRAQLGHDIRTPINAILGYCELLIDVGNESGNTSLIPDLERTRAAARQLLDHIDEILRFPSAGPGEAGVPDSFPVKATEAEDALARIHPLAATPDLSYHQGSLLVVDDNETNRDLLSRQLARRGYTVSTARNGREALDLVRSQDFDLVLLDILMPGISGVEVLQQLKSDPELRDIPVIMITALDEIDSAVRCIEMGAEDYLSKPFDPVLLGARIGANLEVRRLRDRQRAIEESLRGQQNLLQQVLLARVPAAIAERLRAGEANFVEPYPEATVLWACLEGLARLAARSGPTEFAARINSLAAVFTGIAERHGIETVRFEGHTCVMVGGAPSPLRDHAAAVAEAALDMHDEVSRNAAHHEPIRLRLGIHTGSLVAGVIGDQLAYDVWGDAVDTAQCLAFYGATGSIQVSPASHALLRDRYHLDSRGVVDLGGRGQMRAYLLLRRNEPVPDLPEREAQAIP